MTLKTYIALKETQAYRFAAMAHEARFPAMYWKATLLDMMGLPMGSRPTLTQLQEQPHHNSTLWANMVDRFGRFTTVRWAEYLENEEERIHIALGLLGTNPDLVSERLQGMGVMGSILDYCDCPIAKYLTAVYGAWFVEITQSTSLVDFVRCSNQNQVGIFVRRFDHHRIPRLDLHSEDNVIV